MGLEAVEVVIALEKEFGTDIPDADAAAMLTPRHVADWLAARLDVRPLSPCRTRRAFHRLRAALHEELGVPRAAIRPAARLEDVLPAGAPRERWDAVRGRLGRGWQPRRVNWAGDALHALAGDARPPRYRGRRDGQTLGDTARDVAAWNADLRPAAGQPWSREAVALTVRRIVHEEAAQFGFRDDASFTADLGFD